MRERPTWLIASRELREAMRSTSFKVTLLISALALAAIIVIANLGDDGPSTQDVVVAGDVAAERIDALAAVAEAAGVRVQVTTVADDAAARALLDDGDADLVVAADGTRLTTREPIDLEESSDLARLINVLRADIALANGLAAAGLTPEQAEAVRAAPPPEVESLHAEDPDDIDGGRVATATITNILLFLLLQSYGQSVLIGVSREKESRVVEVLLSVISSRQLLVGKVIGIGLLALLHAVVLIVTALVATRAMGVDLTAGIAVGDLALAGVWFLLGYALYCNAYAAAGSLVSRVEDAQSTAFPVMLPLLLGYLVSFTAADGANTLLWVLAFIPLTAVVAMPTLYAIGAAPVWAMLLSMVLTAIGVVIVARVAARIYARSVLQSGKRVGLRQALGRDDTGTDHAEPERAAA